MKKKTNPVLTALKHHPKVVERFRKVQRKLALYPQTYNQETWGCKINKTVNTPCGTAACIGGHYILLGGGKFKVDGGLFTKSGEIVSITERVTKDLGGVIEPERMEAIHETISMLFTGQPQDYWPEPFRTMWEASLPSHRPYIAIARIEHFLAHGE